MALDRIFHDKDYWQEDAFNRIKSELLSVKDNRFVQYSHTAATHLVCVYGKSQVGKTTLILNMIGLKDDVCKKEVSDVLRGGIALGNSSTSTAISYSQSDSDDLYGVAIETLDGKKTANIEYFTADKMPEKLKSIRDKVESNEFSDKWILHIFIPRNFFPLSESESKISILDLPGIESRNIQEKAHVDSLMTRYVPLSSVCIITWAANEIQSLEDLELPNNLDWKNLPHKFFIVITKSYSVGIIKDYFKSPRNQRETRFKDFLLNQYKEDLSNILGKNFVTKIFLLDMGASFVSLCKELINEEDRGEVTETRDCYLSSLRESILSSKGNNLRSCIKELEVIANKIEDNKILRLKEIGKKLEEEKIKIVKGIEKLKNSNDNNKCNYREIESSIKQLDSLNQSVENKLSKAATSFSDKMIARVKKEIGEKSLFKNKNGTIYFYDKNKICMKVIQDQFTNHFDEIVVSEARSLMGNSDLNLDFYPSIIANSILDQFANIYEIKLYPPSNFFKNIFGNSSKVDIQSAYGYIQQIKTIIRSVIISKCKVAINKKRDEYSKELERCKYLQNKEENKIKSNEAEIERIKDKIDTNNEELDAVQKQKELDMQTLRGYLTHATEAYLSQRNKIFKMINSNDTSPTDKFLYIILLGIIDKDYKNITNASNE